MKKLTLCVLVAFVACRPPAPNEVMTEPVRVAPESLEFGEVWLSKTSTREVTLTNPSRAAQSVTLSADAPFTIAASLYELSGGEVRVVNIVFAPSSAGEFSGVLKVGDANVSLHGVAKAVPNCGAALPCRVTAFDFERGECVETNRDDGTACDAPYSCFQRAECRAGTCIGTQTNCNDGNACTLNACGETGCVFPDNSLSCPLPTDPCLAPACDVDAGCTSIAVVDGTPCGPRTCSTARICLSAQCVTRTAPLTQACVDVVAGSPAGPGLVDAPGIDARFWFTERLVEDADGTVYFGTSNEGVGFVRRVTLQGDVRTIAGGGAARADGYGRRVGFLTYPQVVGWDSQKNLVVAETDFGVLYTPSSLRRVSRSGQVITICRDCIPVGGHARVVAANGDVVGFNEDESLFIVDTFGQYRSFTTEARLPIDILSADPIRLLAYRGLYEVDPPVGSRATERLLNSAHEGQWFGTSRVTADGGREYFARTGPPANGPLNLVGVEDETRLTPISFSADGGYWLYDNARFHLRRVEGGVMRTVAGPISHRALVDGFPGALLSSPERLLPRGDGVLVLDANAIREFTGGAMHTHVADAGVTEWTDIALTPSGTALVLRPGGLSAFDPTSWSRTDDWNFSRGSVRSIAMTADGGLLLANNDSLPARFGYDGGSTSLDLCYRVRPTLSGEGAWAHCGGLLGPSSLRHWTASGGLTRAHDAGWLDFYEESPDVLIVSVEHGLGRLFIDGGVYQPLIELSERPTSIAPAPDGGVLIGVPHAILRVRLQ